MVSIFLEKCNRASRSTEPTDLVGFVEFGGYRWHHCHGVLAGTDTRDGSQDVRVATRVAESRRMVQQSQQTRVWAHTVQSLRVTSPLEKRIKQEIVRRTPRKFAIHMPPKIAHRFERDISNGPRAFTSLTSSRFCPFAWCCEGVTRSGSLSDDMGVWEQVTRLVTSRATVFVQVWSILSNEIKMNGTLEIRVIRQTGAVLIGSSMTLLSVHKLATRPFFGRRRLNNSVAPGVNSARCSE